MQGLRTAAGPRRAGRRRVALVAVAAAVVWLGISVGSALTGPGSDSTAARLAEWARGHGLSSVVDRLERVTYTAPKVGGTPAPGSPILAAAVPAAAGHADLAPIASPALPGEGRFRTVLQIAGQPAVQVAFLRPDQIHTSYTAAVARLDQRVLSFALHPGTQEPGHGPWPVSDHITPAQRPSLVAAFNGGFRLDAARGGIFLAGRTVGKLRRGAASLVLRRDGRASVGTWGRDATLTGDVVAVRQNLDLLVDGGRVVAGLDSNLHGRWGKTLGNKLYVWRSGVGETADGALVYAAGNRLSAATLARLLQRAGCTRAMELDINPEWTSFVNYPAEANLLPDMQRSPRRYDTTSTRDFITVSRRP